MNNRSSWKSAFNAAVKKTKFPIFLKIAGYIILFGLVSKSLEFFGYSDHFLMSLITLSAVLFLAKFCFVLIQEKNK